jgi:hypothetical protein
MFRSYDHLQAEIYLLGFTRLTTDPFFRIELTLCITIVIGSLIMDDDECGTVGRMTGRGNPSTMRKPVPV